MGSTLAGLLLGCAAAGFPGEAFAQDIESKNVVEVAEENVGSLGVTLSSAPAIDLTVNAASGDTGAVTVSPASLSFTTMNWDEEQWFDILPVQDADTTDESVTLTLSGAGLTDKTVTVEVRDDDLGLALTSSPVPVTEGGTATFDVRLGSQPRQDRTVEVESGDPGAATVDPRFLSFTAMTWNVAQPVTVTGVQDANRADEQVNISLSGPGLVGGTVTIDVNDDDTPVALTLTPPVVRVNEGSTSTFNVELASAPLATVTVNVTSDDPGAATVNLSSLTFMTTTWNVAQPVTVTGVQDSNRADERVTITLSGPGVVTGTVTVDVNDDDTPPPRPPPPPRPSPPGAPGQPDVTPGDGTLAVSWAAVARADRYTVQWRSGSEGYAGSRQQTVDTPPVTLAGLTNGEEHTVRVRASNAGGDSAWSEESSGTPTTHVPALPLAGAALLGMLLALLGRRLRTRAATG